MQKTLYAKNPERSIIKVKPLFYAVSTFFITIQWTVYLQLMGAKRKFLNALQRINNETGVCKLLMFQ